MKQKYAIVEIINERGFHARPAALFVRSANAFHSAVSVKNLASGETADGKSLMSLLALAAAKGTKLKITAGGPDADKAVKTLEKMIAGGFDEE